MATISIIGDSQGGGLTQLGQLGAALEGKGWTLGRFFYRNGASTQRLLSDLPEILSGGAPHAVIVAAGGNDGTADAPHWLTLVAALRSRGVRRVFWVGPPAAADIGSPLDVAREGVSRLQQSVLQGQPGVTWISGRTTAQGLPRRDTVHLTAEGYAEWARRLASRIDAGTGRGLVTVALTVGALGAAWYGAQKLADGRRW